MSKGKKMKSKKIVILTGFFLILAMFPILALSSPPPMIYYSIDILTPENKLYEPPLNTGHYPATYSFEDDQDGAKPSGWDVVETGGSLRIKTPLPKNYLVITLFLRPLLFDQIL